MITVVNNKLISDLSREELIQVINRSKDDLKACRKRTLELADMYEDDARWTHKRYRELITTCVIIIASLVSYGVALTIKYYAGV